MGTVVFLFIFNIGISIFVFLLTGMMIFSQVLFIIYAMFLPISFILSMIPTYESMAKKALTKLFNTIMLRAGITLIITTAFSISTMFYSISAGYPFFMIAFLQIVTFAGIYMKLGDLMSMFSLQANDTQQVGRRIMRRPYMFLSRRARRLERKIGRTALAGAVAASKSRKSDTAKTGNRTRPNHDTKSSDTSSFGKRAGAKVGAVLDGKDRIRDKAQSMKQQVKDMPTQAQYAIHSGVSQIQENVSDFKRGIVEEKESRKQGRADRQDKHRQTIAEKRMELDRAKQGTGSATNAGTAKGTAPVYERPVTTPVSATKEQAQFTKEKEPVTKQQEKTRTQVVRKDSQTATKQGMPTQNTDRQMVKVQKQTNTVQKKTTNKFTVNKNRKGNKI